MQDYRPFKEGVDLKKHFNKDFGEIEKSQEILSIYDEFSDNNVTEYLINYPAVILSSSYNFHKTNKSCFKNIKKLFKEAKEEKIGVIQICDYQNRDSIRSLIGEDVLYYYGDSDVGKIIIRSDPGIILLQNGIMRFL